MSKLKTIFTDDDSAMMIAIVDFCALSRPDLAHRLCTWHKKMNFSRHLSAPRVTAAARDLADNLFDEMCYTKTETHVLGRLGNSGD
jgi:hypothetical protein